LAGRKTIGKLAGLGRWNAWDQPEITSRSQCALTTPSECMLCTIDTNAWILSSLHSTMPIVTGVKPSRARYATGIILLVNDDVWVSGPTSGGCVNLGAH